MTTTVLPTRPLTPVGQPVRQPRVDGPGTVRDALRPLGVHSECGVLRRAVADVAGRSGRGGGAGAERVADALRSRGVQILALRDLLADVLVSRSSRNVITERVVTVGAASSAAARRIQHMLDEAPADLAAEFLLSGIPASGRGEDGRSPERAQYLLAPLPVSRSLRAPTITIGATTYPAISGSVEARRAVVAMGLIHRLHPRLSDLRQRLYLRDRAARRAGARVDGDDVQLAPDGSLVIGIGRHTSAAGARQLARSALAAGVAPRAVIVALPAGAATERLDRMLGVFDRGVALVHVAALSDDAWAWVVGVSGDGGALTVGAPRPLRAVLPELLGPEARIVVRPLREDAAGPQHYLPWEPGAVLTCAAETDPTSALLERAGVEVLPLPRVRGPVGGIRRLVQPLLRDAVAA